MKLKCQTDEKGKPYNDQIRQVHYMFLNRRIGQTQQRMYSTFKLMGITLNGFSVIK
jgi:hypothetical protein